MAILKARARAVTSVSASGKLQIVRRRHADITVYDWVGEQFPEFIQSDYPRMVEFAKTYYKYISSVTENGEIDDIKDIDFTSGDYLLKLRKEFSYNSTKFNFLSESEFIRHAKEFYASKGSEESIKFLFRIMFDSGVEVEYPADRIFSPSAAHWQQLRSIKVRINANSISPDNFIGSFLTVRSSTGQTQIIEVDRVDDITTKEDLDEVSTRFEIFFPSEIFIDINIDDVVLGDSFEATIIPSLASVRIVSPGVNFRIGQIIKLDGVTGSGAVGVISGIDSNGGLKNVKILLFGKDYSTNFYVSIEPEGLFADAGTSVGGSSTLATYQRAITDNQTSYQEQLDVLKSDYVLNDSTGTYKFYVAPGYFGQYFVQHRNNQTFFEETVTKGLIYCTVGAISTYPGSFLDKAGAVSDYSVLQDGEYYQKFSYKIKSKQDISEYKDIVTTFAHPAGLKLFGEYSIESSFENDLSVGSTEFTQHTVYEPGYLGAKIKITTKAEGVFPQGNSLESSLTKTVMPVTISGNITLINNMQYISVTGEESVKLYVSPTLKVR